MKISKNLNVSTIKMAHRAACVSSKIEGLSFNEAKKDKKSIAILKNHGRAFSVSCK